MKSIRCLYCGFHNWITEEKCKRCARTLFKESNYSGQSSLSHLLKQNHKTEIGLHPRGVAAAWFSVAALLPVIFFFILFGRSSYFAESGSKQAITSLYIYGVIPLLTAALCGFFMGGKILDPNKTNHSHQAVFRGMLVAGSSFVLFIFTVAVVFSVSATNNPFLILYGIVAIFFFLLFGSIFVGWLALIAGGVVGFWLYSIPKDENLEYQAIESGRVGKDVVKKWLTVAIIIFQFSLVPAVIGMSAVSDERTAEVNRTR